MNKSFKKEEVLDNINTIIALSSNRKNKAIYDTATFLLRFTNSLEFDTELFQDVNLDKDKLTTIFVTMFMEFVKGQLKYYIN